MSLINIFMKRDGMSRQEAEEQVESMKEEVALGANPEDILYEEGLEPDYFWELV